MHRKSSVNSQEIVLCQNPVKHLRWSVLKIKSTAFGRYLFLQNTQSYMFDSFMNTSLLCCECFPRTFGKFDSYFSLKSFQSTRSLNHETCSPCLLTQCWLQVCLVIPATTSGIAFLELAQHSRGEGKF